MAIRFFDRFRTAQRRYASGVHELGTGAESTPGHLKVTVLDANREAEDAIVRFLQSQAQVRILETGAAAAAECRIGNSACPAVRHPDFH